MKKIAFLNLLVPVLLSGMGSMVLFLGSSVNAQEKSAMDLPSTNAQLANGFERDVASVPGANGESREETEKIAQKVRTRSYPGGNDESDLKVQSLLQKPTRKMAPNAEETSDSAASQD